MLEASIACGRDEWVTTRRVQVTKDIGAAPVEVDQGLLCVRQCVRRAGVLTGLPSNTPVVPPQN